MQTPLHVSAGYNNVEIVNFLLNWQGPEKVKLEAKNMVGNCFQKSTTVTFLRILISWFEMWLSQYGETPLHMAAKNGCSEAARLLLHHGATVEAKANNGMTPLHLAVWSSLMGDNSLTVKTLLDYNADCSV
uniref:Uncharacterized protein n=1 Tax=Nelumbo nucifera TaxID=4432 RepID=A0A822ZP30_NELNU|nr:TPA_asm: hypothetical protein HUJ06_002906 [Nelumbo nucifera]